MERIFACACGLRSTAISKAPGRTSSTYLPRPVTNRSSSTLATGSPILRVVTAPARPAPTHPAPAHPVRAATRRRARPIRRCSDSRCSGTGCPRSSRAPPPGSDRGFRLSRGDRREESGGAEAALQPVAVFEGLLHWAERAVPAGEALDGGDLVVLGTDGEHQAGPHGLAVDEDRARPAHAVFAAHVGTGQSDVVAQRVAEIGRASCRERVWM